MTEPCPPDDELLSYVERTLPLARRSEIEQHLASCETCPTVAAAAARELHTSQSGDDGEPEPTSPARVLATGEQLGRYVILELIGRGAMGVVYAAYDPKLDRKIALKVVRPDRRQSEIEERFVREGKTMARLSHPNVVAVHDAGVLDDHGGVFLAMAYVHGVTLRAWLASEPRSWRTILDAYLQAGRGLGAAHRAGIVHRDFKPDNVLVGIDGEVRVTDFGLARAGDEMSSVAATADSDGDVASPVLATAHGAVLGTPAFMAPEQLRGETATAAADQFAFASALYQSLFGQHPFGGEGYAALREAVLAGALKEPPRSPVPAYVRRALRRALQPSPAARYARIDDLLAALVADPRRRLRSIAVVAGPLAIAAGVITWQLAGARADRAEPCRAGEARVAAVWNPALRETIRSAFTATGLPYAPRASDEAAGELARYADRWTTGYREACEATRVRGEQSEALLDRRMTCLDERLRDLGAAASQLARADRSTVEKTSDLLAGMRSLDACADRTRMLAQVAPPGDAALAARVAGVRDELAALRAARVAGQVGTEMLARADRAVALADAVPYPPLAGEARIVRAKFQFSNGKYDAAIAALEMAVLTGERNGDDEQVNEALLELANVTSYAQKVDDAVRAATLAEAKTARLGNAPIARAEVLRVKAAVLEHKLSAADAVPLAQEALAIYERELGPHALATVRALASLAGARYRASQYGEAMTLQERVVKEYEAALGPNHAEVAAALHELSSSQRAMGRRREGLATIERAVAINTANLGASHMWVGANLFVVAQIQYELGRRSEAVETLKRSIAVLEASGGPENGELLAPLAYLCMAGTSLPDGAAHLPACERVRDLARKLVGPDGAVTALVETTYVIGLENLDRLDEACAALARPAAILEKAEPTSTDRPLGLQARCARFHGNPKRAVELAREALGLVTSAFPPHHPDVASARMELGAALIDAGEAAAAVPLLEQATRDLETAEIDPAAHLDAKSELGAALRISGLDRARGDALLAEAGPPLLSLPYATPFLRRRLRAWLGR